MAKFTLSTSDALTRKVYEEKTFRDTVKESYFSRFMSKEDGDDNAAVQVKTELEGGRGDAIKFSLRMRLSGQGVTGSTPLEGNEEAIQAYQDEVVLEKYRHAVRDEGELENMRAQFNVTKEMENSIKDWGKEKIDSLCFDALIASPTKTFYPNSSGVLTSNATESTAISGLDATNSKITLNHISAIKAWAITGGNRAYTPIRPISVDGGKYFVLLVHPDVMYDLKASSAWQQAQREAQIRGDKNPLFTGAAGIYDGVVIHEHENVARSGTGGGGSVEYAKCSFFGAQSLLWAWGKRPKLIKRDFDYGDEMGMGWRMIAGVTRPTFNSLNFGSVNAYFACTNISGL